MAENNFTRIVLFIVRIKKIWDTEDLPVLCQHDLQYCNTLQYYMLLPPSMRDTSIGESFHMRNIGVLQDSGLSSFEDRVISSTGVDVIELLIETYSDNNEVVVYAKEENLSSTDSIFTSALRTSNFRSVIFVKGIDQYQLRNYSFPWTDDSVVFKVFHLALRVKILRESSTFLQKLLELDVDINAIGSDPSQRTLLHTAAERGAVDAIQLLLRYGASLNAMDCRGRLPLFSAALANRLDAVAALIEAGANVNIIDILGEDVLRAVCLRNLPEMAVLLLRNNADQEGLLTVVASQPGLGRVAEVLCNFGARGDTIGANGETALHEAVKHCDLGMLAILIRNSDDLNVVGSVSQSTNVSGYNLTNAGTPLIAAIEGEDEEKALEVVKLLIQHGVDPNKRVEYSALPLVAAAKSKFLKVLTLFCQLGAPDALDAENWKSLWSVAGVKCPEIVRVLIRYGFDLNQSDKITPLHSIFSKRICKGRISLDVVKIIIECGSFLNVSNSSGYLGIVEEAPFARNWEIYQCLMEYNFKDLAPIMPGLKVTLMHISSNSRSVFLEVLFKINAFDLFINQSVVINQNCQSFDILRQTVDCILDRYYDKYDRLREIVEKNCFECIEKCLGELPLMKQTFVRNSPWTFYDVLTKDIHDLANLAKNDEFAKPLEYSRFPMYGKMLEYQHLKGCHRRKLIDRVSKISPRAFKGLPKEFAMNILEQLNNRDLLVFETACYPAH